MASMSAIRIVFVSGGIRHLSKPKPKSRPIIRRELGLNARLQRKDSIAVDLPVILAATFARSSSSLRTHLYEHDKPQSISEETLMQQEILPESGATHDLFIHQVRRCLYIEKPKY